MTIDQPTPEGFDLPGPEVTLAQVVFPNMVNHYGTLFGGEALRLMDEAAFMAAARLVRLPVVTVSLDRVDFRAPVHAGELVEARARVVRVGRSSIGVEVALTAEDLLTGERREATRGQFTFVAVDRDGHPTPVRP
jgi:uncharacterized protein (TIGR00369 family)